MMMIRFHDLKRCAISTSHFQWNASLNVRNVQGNEYTDYCPQIFQYQDTLAIPILSLYAGDLPKPTHTRKKHAVVRHHSYQRFKKAPEWVKIHDSSHVVRPMKKTNTTSISVSPLAIQHQYKSTITYWYQWYPYWSFVPQKIWLHAAHLSSLISPNLACLIDRGTMLLCRRSSKCDCRGSTVSVPSCIKVLGESQPIHVDR